MQTKQTGFGRNKRFRSTLLSARTGQSQGTRRTTLSSGWPPRVSIRVRALQSSERRSQCNRLGVVLRWSSTAPGENQVRLQEDLSLGSRLAKVRPRRRDGLRTFLKKPPHVVDAHSPKFLSADVAQMKLAQSSQINRDVGSGNSDARGLDRQTIVPSTPDVPAALIKLRRQH